MKTNSKEEMRKNILSNPIDSCVFLGSDDELKFTFADNRLKKLDEQLSKENIEFCRSSTMDGLKVLSPALTCSIIWFNITKHSNKMTLNWVLKKMLKKEKLKIFCTNGLITG